LIYLLYGLFFLSCIVLIAAVLLQPGKTDAGALFTSNVSSSALAPRGTATILSKITIAAAVLFMLSALFLSMPALTGNISVLSSNPDASAPAQTEAAAPDANANTASDNTNEALIQTPATDQIEKQMANAQAANAVPANAAVTNANTAAPANAAANR
jgi:preprotein translocase subunit SecG